MHAIAYPNMYIHTHTHAHMHVHTHTHIHTYFLAHPSFKCDNPLLCDVAKSPQHPLPCAQLLSQNQPCCCLGFALGRLQQSIQAALVSLQRPLFASNLLACLCCALATPGSRSGLGMRMDPHALHNAVLPDLPRHCTARHSVAQPDLNKHHKCPAQCSPA